MVRVSGDRRRGVRQCSMDMVVTITGTEATAGTIGVMEVADMTIGVEGTGEEGIRVVAEEVGGDTRSKMIK